MAPLHDLCFTRTTHSALLLPRIGLEPLLEPTLTNRGPRVLILGAARRAGGSGGKHLLVPTVDHHTTHPVVGMHIALHGGENAEIDLERFLESKRANVQVGMCVCMYISTPQICLCFVSIPSSLQSASSSSHLQQVAPSVFSLRRHRRHRRLLSFRIHFFHGQIKTRKSNSRDLDLSFTLLQSDLLLPRSINIVSSIETST